MAGQLLIRAEKITKRFRQTVALDQVTMEIYSGEIHGLIGENGSGKSTISNIINGIQEQTSGTIWMEGAVYAPRTCIEANRRGVSMIAQEMSTIEDLTVAENIFFGNEAGFMRRGIMDQKAMNQKAREYLLECGLDYINPGDEITCCNFEDRKLVELVRATYMNPKLLVVDETTTALSQDGRDRLFGVIRRLREAGAAVMLISHDLQEVLSLCDRITVLRDGRLVRSLPNQDLTEDDLKLLMIGREFNGAYYREDMLKELSADVVMKVEDVNVKGKLSHISFELHRGEILGIGGLSDSGMHDLAKACFGALRPDSGSVRLVQKNEEVTSIRRAIRSGMAYTSKNRDQEGLVVQAGIGENICLASLDRLSSRGWIAPGRSRRLAQTYAEQMKVKMSHVDQFVSELSGGNKQKVVLAKWLARDSDVLILDSPTRGIDVMVKASIYQLMQDLTARGKSILLISEELMELMGMCDRLLVMKNGELSGELGRSEGFSEEKIIHYMV